jgi:uncharacterized protein YndB with AHSA1/START domain
MSDFLISRVFDAPRQRVWKAWTDAAELKQWWGPKGCKVHTSKVDLRPGGSFHYGMTMPDGGGIWGRFIYREIDAPRRLAFIVSFSNPQGGQTRHPWNANWPLEILSSVTFEEQGQGKTKVTVQWRPHDSSSELERKTFDEGRDSMKQGWSGTFDRLNDYLDKNHRKAVTEK